MCYNASYVFTLVMELLEPRNSSKASISLFLWEFEPFFSESFFFDFFFDALSFLFFFVDFENSCKKGSGVTIQNK